MKYCSKCGNELHDEAVICPKCGCEVEGSRKQVVSESETINVAKAKKNLKTALILMIIGYVISLGLMIPFSIAELYTAYTIVAIIATPLGIAALVYVIFVLMDGYKLDNKTPAILTTVGIFVPILIFIGFSMLNKEFKNLPQAQ
ncbi:MAG: hypothetical protein ACOX28_01545 [Bacilli bacterium]